MRRVPQYLMLMLTIHLSITACKNKSYHITYESLPETGKAVLITHFPGRSIKIMKRKADVYEVVFRGGEIVGFDLRGNWKAIDCLSGAVPEDLVPDQIRSFVAKRHQGATIVAVGREADRFVIRLDKGIEIEFNGDLTLLDHDDDTLP